MNDDLSARLRAVRPFLILAVVAIVVGGLVSAVTAHAPARTIMWMVAYLVLVAGLAQAILGFGQILLPAKLPSSRFMVAECTLFNAGNVGVIAGTLLVWPLLVAAGTLVFVASLLMFMAGVRGARGGWPVQVFRTVLGLVCVGAVVGMVLSFLGVTR